MADLLQSFGVDARLLIIQAVNFAVLLGALTYFLYKPVLKVLDERREKIAQGVADAQKASEELADASKTAEGIVSTATDSAEQILSTSKDAAMQKGKELIDEAQARSERIEADAQAKAAEAAKRALDGSNEQIARTAILAAERLLKKKLN
jgi:F-type H+-transporting ATPase subunit b